MAQLRAGLARIGSDCEEQQQKELDFDFDFDFELEQLENPALADILTMEQIREEYAFTTDYDSEIDSDIEIE